MSKDGAGWRGSREETYIPSRKHKPMDVLSSTVKGLEGEVYGGGRRVSATMFSSSGQYPYRVQMEGHNTDMNII